MKEVKDVTIIEKVMAMFQEPWAKVAALAMICVTVVMLSGCQLSGSGIDIDGIGSIDDIAIEMVGDF